MKLAVERGDWSTETGSLLCQLLEVHPGLDRLWLSLAEFYNHRQDWRLEYHCLERASLAESSVNVENTAQLMEVSPLSDEDKEEIREQVRRNISVPRHQRRREEFVDIGSSVQRKEKEEKMGKILLSKDNCDLILNTFENKWFRIV